MNSFESALATAVSPAKRQLLGAIGLVVDATGKPLYHHANGHQSLAPSAPPLDPDSVVKLGSAGKLITHIAALQCVESGLLRPLELDQSEKRGTLRLGVDEVEAWLDKPVDAWLPELRFDKLQVIEAAPEGGFVLRPPTQNITLRHLLAHTSGLAAGDEPLVKQWRASVEEPKEGNSFDSVPLLFDPGAGYAYGISINWTGRLVARVSGKSLSEYVQKNIYDRLDMTASTVPPRTNPHSERLLQMVCRSDDAAAELVPVVDENPDFSCSVRDLGALLADLLAPTSKILIVPANVDLLFKAQFADGSKLLADLRAETEKYGAVTVGIPASVGTEALPPVNWCLGGALIVDPEGARELPVSRVPSGTVSWSGMPNVVWAIHRKRGVGMVFATQLVPVDDEATVAIMMEFFRGAWGTFGGTRSE
ncbi:beta-lactamase/transpeptidase-like protein [Mycena epipterygia]|nr:beta-lactamase/transpeptidase-like protein [Mycena epipterygia]